MAIVITQGQAEKNAVFLWIRPHKDDIEASQRQENKNFEKNRARQSHSMYDQSFTNTTVKVIKKTVLDAFERF